ncbi:ubiquitin-like domain-containing protein [Halobacillus seohaensis]|uniref:Ubiquitin-like domain-containing protein n=1 Tax=Halobacillus seohaensis TaxID=447421 RepID=A0ABW2EHX2_9BACI
MKLIKSLKSMISSTMILTFIFSTLSIAFLGIITYEATKASVKVTQSGETQVVRTHTNTIEELLNELGVTPQPNDELSHELTQPIQYGMGVEYIASKSINVSINQDTNEFHTTVSTVGKFLDEQEIELKEHDEVSHDSSDQIQDEMELSIQQATQVTLSDGGDKQEVWTTASTVGEFLNEENLELNKFDELNVNKEDPLSDENKVTITRIEKVTDIVKENIDYTVVTKKDDSLLEGKEEVVTSGEQGKVTKEYEITIKNGEESERELINEEVEKESKNEVVALGTKQKETPNPVRTSTPATASAKSSGSSKEAVSYSEDSGSKTLQMNATAYTADCAGCSGVTATGIDLNSNPNKKVVAVDPNVIPLGSTVWVEGYGTAVAGDTGGAIQGNKIDVHVPSKSQAYGFGRKSVQVKVLD